MAIAEERLAQPLSPSPSTLPSSAPAEPLEQDLAEQSRVTPARSWKWVLLGVNLCVTAGAVAVGCFLWLISLPPTPDCQKLSAIAADGERLYCAQQAAQSGDSADLIAALNLVEPWGEQHPLYLQKQQQLERWSEEILELAKQQAYDSNLDEAVSLAQRIPNSSSIYDRAQSSIQAWQTEWQRGESVYAVAQAALQQKDWETAQAQVKQLSEFSHPYWRSQQSQALTQQIVIEQRAHKISTQAQSLAQEGSTQAIRSAIVKAQSLDQATYSWESLQPKFKVWNEILLQRGLELWYEAKLDQAIDLGQLVANYPDLKTEANHLVTLSQARKRAIISTPAWEPTIPHLWHLTQAVEIAHQIKPESQFYPQAASSIESWNQQLEDLKQIHYAQMAADSRTKGGYQYAIQQAKQIGEDRPRRLQAQTLSAHWQKEIERIEDRPHLVVAKQLAASGLTDDLKYAIARAQQIAPDRALHGEAQSLIYQWRSDLQAIEDRPILREARQLADEGNLQGAINTASQIRSGRSLYGQAQRAIARWRSELEESQARDRELDAEKDLTELQQPAPVERFPLQFSSPPMPLELLSPEAEEATSPEQPPQSEPSNPPSLPEESQSDSPVNSSSEVQADQTDQMVPESRGAEVEVDVPSPPSTLNSSPEEAQSDQEGVSESDSSDPETSPSNSQELSSILPLEDRLFSDNLSEQNHTAQPFDLHVEFSQDRFPLLAVGSLFVGV